MFKQKVGTVITVIKAVWHIFFMNEDSIKLRGKLSASSPANAWTMECDIREQLLAYIAKQQSDYLPVERITMAERRY